MTWAVLLMALGAFFAGGSISFRQQRKPAWSVLLLALLAAALVGLGGYAAFESR